MKKILIVWAFVVLMLPMVANAVIINTARDGEVWIEGPQQDITKTEVVFDQEVLKYGGVWKRAFRTPGVVVAIEEHFTYKRKDKDLFHINKTQVIDVGILYVNGWVRVVHDVTGESKEVYTPFVILWFISLLGVIGGLVLARRGNGYASPLAIFVITITTLSSLATIATLADFTPRTAVVLLIALCVLTVNSSGVFDPRYKKAFYRTAVILCLAMALSMASFLLI